MRLEGVEGKTIVKMRRITDKEKEALGWDDEEGLALQLEGGTLLYASVLGKKKGKMFVLNPKC